MSHFVSEIPGVIVKPATSQGNMITTVKLKVLLVLVALLLYIYVLMFIKSFYLKSKRLDRIMEMVLESEKQLFNVHNMDQTLASQISRVEKMYEDY